MVKENPNLLIFLLVNSKMPIMNLELMAKQVIMIYPLTEINHWEVMRKFILSKRANKD